MSRMLTHDADVKRFAGEWRRSRRGIEEVAHAVIRNSSVVVSRRLTDQASTSQRSVAPDPRAALTDSRA